MKFSLYSLLSQLILGFLWLIVIVRYSEIKLSEEVDLSVAGVALAFILGYFINAISSWVENIIYASWGGKPSRKLLLGEGMWRIRFARHQKARKTLIEERETKLKEEQDIEHEEEQKIETNLNDNKHLDVLFSIAMSYSGKEESSRIQEFNANYAFSRGLIVALIGVFLFVLIETLVKDSYTSEKCIVMIFSVIGLIMAWYRTKERGYYLAKEVLNNYLRVKNAAKNP